MDFKVAFSRRAVRRAKNKLIASRAISHNIPNQIRDNLNDLAKLGEVLDKIKKIINLSRISEREKRIYIRSEIRLTRISDLKRSRLVRDLQLSRRHKLLDMLDNLAGISQSMRYQNIDRSNLMVDQVRQSGGLLPSAMPFVGPVSGTQGMVYEIDPLVHGLTCPHCLSALDISDISGLSVCHCTTCNTRIDISKISSSRFMARLHNRGLINPIDPRSYANFTDQNITDFDRIQKNINESKYLTSLKEAKNNNNKSRKNKSKIRRNKSRKNREKKMNKINRDNQLISLIFSSKQNISKQNTGSSLGK